MRKLIMVLLMVCFLGCNRGDFKATVVIEGQPAPHDGINVGPEMIVRQGDPVKVSGLVVYIKGMDPNDIFGETQ